MHRKARKGQLACLTVAVAICVLCHGRPGHAQRGFAPFSKSRVVLEACVGPRMEEAEVVMQQLHKLMLTEVTSYIWDEAALTSSFSRHLSSPGMSGTGYTAAYFVAEVRLASREWSNGKFEIARRQLESALEQARLNPAVIAQDDKAQEAMKRALLYLGLTNQRIAAATSSARLKSAAIAKRDAAMSEYIRTFKEPITRSAFGNEAEQLYSETFTLMSRAAPGVLEIQGPSAKETIFESVNEMPVGRGPMTLWPGEYRVLVRNAGGVARQFKVEIRENARTVFFYNWDVASVVETVEWIGFRYRSALDRQNEPAVINTLRSDGVLLGETAVFSLSEKNSKLLLSAALYGKDGRLAQRGQVELESAESASNTERLSRLLHFLDGNDVAIESTMEKRDAKAASVRVPAPTMAAGAVAAAGAAADVQAAPKPAGVTSPSRTRTLPALLMITGSIAVATGVVLIAIDQDPTPAPTGTPQQKYYRDTSLAGSIVAGAGAVATGIGYLWWRSTAPSSRVAPSVTAPSAGTGAMLGVAGSF